MSPVAFRVDDGLHRLEREAATEHAECAEQAPFVVVQQVVAPGDRAPQGPLPLRRIAGARRQVEAVTELLEDLGGLHEADASRRELDGQRQAAEPLADRPDGRPGVVAQLQVGPVQVGKAFEEGDAGIDVERRHRIAALPADPQQLAAGDDGRQRRRRADESGDDVRGGREQLLEVVEDEQQDPIAEVQAEDLADRRLGGFAEADRARDGRLDERGVADRSEVDEPRAMREPRGERRRDAEREAGLAAATGTRERDDAALRERLAHGRDLGVSTDERGDRARQVARAARSCGAGGRRPRHRSPRGGGAAPVPRSP